MQLILSELFYREGGEEEALYSFKSRLISSWYQSSDREFIEIQPSDAPGLVLMLLKLTGPENYALWSKAMKLALREKSKLGSTVSSESMPSIVYASNARKLWNDFQERFDRSDLTRIYHLWTAITTLRISTLSRTSEISTFATILMGLNESYRNIRSNVLAKRPVVTVNEAYAIVTQEESQRSLGVVDTHREPLTLLAGRRQDFRAKRPGVICERYGYKRNLKENCFKIIGYPAGFKSKKKNQPAGGKAYTNNVNVNANGEEGKPTTVQVKGVGQFFTEEQYQQLVKLLSKTTTAKSSNNFVGIVTLLSYARMCDWVIDIGGTHHVTYCKDILNNVKRADDQGRHGVPPGISKLTKDLCCSVTFLPDSCNPMPRKPKGSSARVRRGRENASSQCSNTRRYSAEVTHAILPGKARTTLSKRVPVPETDTGGLVENTSGRQSKWRVSSNNKGQGQLQSNDIEHVSHLFSRNGRLEYHMGGMVMRIGRENNGLYLHKESITMAATRVFQRKGEETELWHLRLGHASMKAMQHILGLQNKVDMQSKNEVLVVIKNFVATIQNQFGVNVKVLRSVNGVLQGKCPYEMFHGKPATLDHLTVFGYVCFASNIPGGDTFAPRERRSILIGYSETQKGYRLYDLESIRVFISRDVTFREHIFSFKEGMQIEEDIFPSNTPSVIPAGLRRA
ncbi:PREDICTED: uncharacterized protein LOC109209910 [Nicotiana attenuata]|uniref:uncharacterized protein LOC109209910 n=1 Tax=Nicotiana attenuata TaxID=49451 RepID=UPI000904ED9B|nr:PREDICTED: uncharacterized protein LOC109209910 [Nicotiana attenuata]